MEIHAVVITFSFTFATHSLESVEGEATADDLKILRHSSVFQNRLHIWKSVTFVAG